MYRIRELVADGATSTQIRRLRSELAPLNWGVYIEPEIDSWERYRLQCFETLSRLKAGAALTGPSGAAIRDVAMLGDTPRHVYVSNVTPGRYAPSIRVMPPAPAYDYNGTLLTAPPAMIGHCAWVMDARESLVVADAALAIHRSRWADQVPQTWAVQGRAAAPSRRGTAGAWVRVRQAGLATTQRRGTAGSTSARRRRPAPPVGAVNPRGETRPGTMPPSTMPPGL